MPKYTKATIVRTGAPDTGCGILLQREGWPSVYLEFILERIDFTEPGQYLARLEATGDFGRLAKGILILDRSDAFSSGPLQCIGRPNSRLILRPIENQTWAEVTSCQGLAVHVEAIDPSIHGPNGETVGCA